MDTNTLNEWISVSEAKAYLNQIRLIDDRINDGIEDLERLKAMATKVTASLDGEAVSGTRNPDKITDVVAKIIKLKEDLNALVDKYVDIKREASDLLTRVVDPVQYKILHSRYMLYKTWEQIADEIGYTYQWTCHLHGLALLEFKRILQENEVIIDRN